MEYSLFIELQKAGLNELKLVHENLVVLCATYHGTMQNKNVPEQEEKARKRELTY
jgi:hypothetical protein